MHICYLNMPIEYYSPTTCGAISTIIMEQARRLIAHGHKVSILTIISKGEAYDVGDVIPIRAKTRDDLNIGQRGISKILHKVFRWDWPYYEYYLSSFTSALKKMNSKPEAIILFNDLISPRYIKKVMPEAKIIVNLQNEVCTARENINKIVSCVDVFLCTSGYIKNWMTKTYDIPLHKLRVLLNGVDLETFKPRQDYLTINDTLRVLYIGRIDPNKGPDIVTCAVEALQKKGLSVKLTVAGPLKYWGHNKKTIEIFLKKLESKITTTGAEYPGNVARPRVPSLVRDNDVVCVLSRFNDPCPLSMLEAMASGCAVVASDRGGIPEASDGAAMLVNPDDFDSVVKALRQLATDGGFLKTQKVKSVERAARVSWSVNVDMLESVIKKLLAKED